MSLTLVVLGDLAAAFNRLGNTARDEKLTKLFAGALPELQTGISMKYGATPSRVTLEAKFNMQNLKRDAHDFSFDRAMLSRIMHCLKKFEVMRDGPNTLEQFEMLSSSDRYAPEGDGQWCGMAEAVAETFGVHKMFEAVSFFAWRNSST